MFERTPPSEPDLAPTVGLVDQFDHATGDADRRFDRLFARPVWQGRRVEDQDRIDVGRIIEFATALLAERDARKPHRLSYAPLADRGGDRAIERTIREIAERARDDFERRTREIGKRHRERDQLTLLTQRAHDILIRARDALGLGQHDLKAFAPKAVGYGRMTAQKPPQEGGMGFGERDRPIKKARIQGHTHFRIGAWQAKGRNSAPLPTFYEHGQCKSGYPVPALGYATAAGAGRGSRSA